MEAHFVVAERAPRCHEFGPTVEMYRAIAGDNQNSQMDILYDPFLLLDDFRSNTTPQQRKIMHPHPHRGFETITYLLEGGVTHQDSKGNKGHISAGQIQHLCAGRGVIHDEIPDEGPGHGIQLWINMPKKDKMSKPRYQDIKDLPQIIDEKTKTKITVLSSSSAKLYGVETKLQTKVDMAYLDLEIPPNTIFEQTIPIGFNGMIYVIQGGVRVLMQDGEKKHLEIHSVGLLEETNKRTQESVVKLETTKNKGVKLLLLLGKPIGEPIVRYGPFVMTTQEEIQKCIQDYRNGTLDK